ncbi:hypothetical protein ABFS83_10G074200 [Erythranthe nasuta]
MFTLQDNLYSTQANSRPNYKMAKRASLVVALLVSCCLLATADAAAYKALYKDPKMPINRRIKDLLARMTLEEKIGQMVQIERTVASRDVINKYYIGSVLGGGGSAPSPKAPPEKWVDMVNNFQNGALSTRLGIPMIYGIDAVHGHNGVYKATVFPHNIGLGVTRDPELVKKIGAATALELRATGIPYTFAPCVAVCRDPRWGRCYESYSEDTNVVRAMTEIITGLQGDIPANSPKGVPYISGKEKVVACAKHYVGDGGTTKGINQNDTVISNRGLLSIHMPPYNDSIIKGVSTIMISYSSFNGVKMHANRDLITAYLKNTLRFRGFVISDFEGIDQITTPPHANYTYSILAGVGAGIDMEHRELAREAVRKSLVLLKNGKSSDKPLIPLPKKALKVLVAGTHADDIGNQCGGWTIQWQGQSGNITIGTTILNAVKKAVDPTTKVVFVEKPDIEYVKSNEFSYAIVVVGELPYAEGYGDNLNLTLPEIGYHTITNVCGSMKCVVVLITGRPIVIGPYLGQIDGLVAAWLPGTEGQGVADVLFGDYGFSGKLSRTWFKSVDQLPMNVGDPYYDPLFPFGFGLTTKGVEGVN